MKKFNYFIFFIYFLFLLNLILFLFNDEYKDYLKSLKHQKDDFKTINDDYLLVFNEKDCNCPVCEVCKKCDESEKSLENKFLNQKNNDYSVKNETSIKNEENLKLNEINEERNSSKYSDYVYSILSSFRNKYSLLEIKDYDKNLLFDLTDEYPYEYLIYTWNGIELYFFSNNDYNEIYEMFNYLKNDLKISLNENNAFWERSFFINKNLDDWYFRLCIYKNDILFWLKARKKYYNDIKSIILQI